MASLIALVVLAATVLSCEAAGPVSAPCISHYPPKCTPTPVGCCCALKSLSPPKMTVSVTGFMVDGQKMAGKTAKSADLDQPGTPTLQASMDSVMITYSLPAGSVSGVTGTSVYACYSKASAYDRPWRAAADVLTKDKQCGVEITSGTSESLPPYEGNVTWHIGENVPQATYFVRAYAMCGGTKCAFGNSTGYFQVNPVNNRPKEVIGATIGVMLFGPIVLTIFMLKDRMTGKQH